MGKVIGLGGVFLHLKGDQKELFDWYEKYLGLEFSIYGSGFIEGQQLLMLSLKRNDSTNAPYLNFRVDELDSMIKDLKSNHIQIVSDITEYPYGKFATIMDPFGNAIELWEANEEAYKELVKDELSKYQKAKTK